MTFSSSYSYFIYLKKQSHFATSPPQQSNLVSMGLERWRTSHTSVVEAEKASAPSSGLCLSTPLQAGHELLG